MTDIDADNLPPVQNLIMEVLAARTRLGEVWWTMKTGPGVVMKAFRVLEEAQLIVTRSAVVGPGYVMAMLTESGKRACFADTYVPPIQHAARR